MTLFLEFAICELLCDRARVYTIYPSEGPRTERVGSPALFLEWRWRCQSTNLIFIERRPLTLQRIKHMDRYIIHTRSLSYYII
jgi:hypothetical protein